MVQFLEPRESTGQKLMKGLGMAAESIPDLIGNYQKSKQQKMLFNQKENEFREKLLASSKKYLKGEAPEDLKLENIIDELVPIYSKYINQGYSQSEARDLAFADLREKPEFAQQQREEKGGDLVKGLGGTSMKDLFEGISNTAKGATGFFENTPTTPLPALIKLAQQKSPRKTLEELLQNKTPFQGEKYFDTPYEKILKSSSPEAAKKIQESGDVISQIGTLLGPSIWNKLKGMLPKSAVSPTEILAPEATKQLALKPRQLEQKIKAPPAERPSIRTPQKASLEGKITEAPETPTEMRVERTSPEQRIYPRLENVELREKQLKSHPKYRAEIEQDASDRAARAESRVPKTVKGRDAQRIRVHEAEKAYPVAQESYNKAAGRVRGIEDQIVKLSGQARESAETLLELAKKDLDDATFNLKQAYENLTGVNVRAGVEQMRTAARNKMQQIQDSITSGEEYKIAKMDYSPDLISKAKAISKSKPLPKARSSDFYTQVHDVYANEYKNRVAQINKDLQQLPKTMAGFSQARPLQMEKDILNKMIQSAEAEKTIQNRRFGLREMAERHKAEERFKQIKKDGAKPEVGKVAQERMWKTRIEEAKTPEARSKVIDEGIEQIASEHPEQANKIRAEGAKLKDSVEDLFRTRQAKAPPSMKGERVETGRKGTEAPPKEPKASPQEKEAPKSKGKGLPTPDELATPKNSKETVDWSKKIFEFYKKQIEDLKNSFPTIWKSELGRNIIVGVGTAFYEEAKKEYDLPLSGSQVAAIAFGYPRGAPVRYAVNSFVKWGIRHWKINQAEKAYREKRTKDFHSYSKSIQKKAKDRYYER